MENELKGIERHTVIEASAGTGKTYTVISEVLSLLKKGVALDSILIVTYTEKATGELKTRLRDRILEELYSNKGKIRVYLEKALTTFDTASIFTIHSFCNTILKQYSFENSNLFSTTVINDYFVYEELLKEQKRTLWNQRYVDHLPFILSFSEYDGEKWDKDVIKFATGFLPEIAEIRPYYFPEESIYTFVSETVTDIDAILKELRNILESKLQVEPSIESESEPSKKSSSKTKKSTKEKPVINAKKLKKLTDFIENAKKEVLGVSDFYKELKKLCSNHMEEFAGSESLLPRNILENIYALYKKLVLLESDLKTYTIYKLKEQARKYKSSRGLISFEDMILFVKEAVSKPDKTLVQDIQKKYRYAFVDEFQDTDPNQWEIFYKLFVENTKEHILVVVGDPKQAIYGFRGGDVYTYFEAKRILLQEYNANLLTLNKNFRSLPLLLDFYNQLFSGNWFSNSKEIEYTNVLFPEEVKDKKQSYLFSETGKIETVVTLAHTGSDIQNHITVSSAKSGKILFNKFIVSEILRLLNCSIGTESEKRSVVLGDICILVRSSSEAEDLEELLAEAKIPFFYYKKEGLFESDEALNLYFAISAIENSEDTQYYYKSLLTEFFGLTLSDLQNLEAILTKSNIQSLFDYWVKLASTKQWSKLFNSMLEDTGLSVRAISSIKGERKLANYRQIILELQKEAYNKNLDLSSLLDYFKNRRLVPKSENEENNFYEPESEKSKVTILTMHKSKGLEFPIVFLAGGFTKKNDKDEYTYHLDGKKIYQFTKPDNQLWETEEASENERLFYVAITRAKTKLYLPYLESKNKSHIHIIYTLLFPNIQERIINTFDDWREHITAEPITTDILEPKINKEEIVEEELMEKPVAEFNPPDINKDKIEQIKQRKTELVSYTNLKRKEDAASIELERFFDPNQKVFSIEEWEEPLIVKEEDMSLPGGKNTGNMLHSILEELDYGIVNSFTQEKFLEDKELNYFFIEKLHQFRMLQKKNHIENAEGQLLFKTKEVIWNTLSAELEQGLVLSSLNKKDTKREVKFFYTTSKRKEIFFNGSIDLVFLYNKKYYIADWKSDRLEDYSSEPIKEKIISSGYKIQYQIYTLALFKWIKSRKSNFNIHDFWKVFGGIYYVFLRGMNVNKKKEGYLFISPSELLNVEKEIELIVDQFKMVL